jgi:peptide/nickel transport system substrate-binding protein
VTEIRFGSPTVSRRTVIKGAAATAAVIPMTQILGGEVQAASKVLRLGTQKQVKPAAPWTTSDGSLQILSAVGDYLAYQRVDGSLEPRVATKWKASNGLKTWTFDLRKGVKFHDGTEVTSADVVYTFQAHLKETNKSASIGNFKGVIAAVRAEGAYKVVFDLVAPSGNFPYTVASTSYGAIIIKNGADGGAAWTKTMMSCGPWIMTSYTETEKTVFKKNPNYWDTDKQASLQYDTLEQIQFLSAAAAVPQLKTGKIDAIVLLPEDAVKLNKSKFSIDKVGSAAGIHMHMRCDYGPFTDVRVRKAAALTINRAGYIKGVLKGVGGNIANDSVMDSYPTRDNSVPQREKDLAEAKKLMAAAGNKGFTVDLSTWYRDDIAKFAQVVKSSFAEIGISCNLKVDGSDGGGSVYYTYVPYPSGKGKGPKYDNNSWLASNLGITEWAGRGVPDQYLKREWRSDGDWSGAYTDNATLDAAIDEYLSAGNPKKQSTASGKIQRASLDYTPYIIVYNTNILFVRRSNLKGVSYNGITQIDATGAA